MGGASPRGSLGCPAHMATALSLQGETSSAAGSVICPTPESAAGMFRRADGLPVREHQTQRGARGRGVKQDTSQHRGEPKKHLVLRGGPSEGQRMSPG